MLLDTSALLKWRAANLKLIGQEISDRDTIFVLGAAERALEINPEAPARLFVFLVKGCRRDFITAAQEDRAVARLRVHRVGERSTEVRAPVSAAAVLLRRAAMIVKRSGRSPIVSELPIQRTFL
jgi:hypothetical protein